MLTQEQIEKLEPLTKHPRFGQILQDAMTNWMLPNVTPKMAFWGVDWLNGRYVLSKNFRGRCCLIGSYVINKENEDAQDPFCSDIASQYSGIEFVEITAIISGFDQSISYTGLFQDAYNFGKQVSIILFGDINA